MTSQTTTLTTARTGRHGDRSGLLLLAAMCVLPVAGSALVAVGFWLVSLLQ